MISIILINTYNLFIYQIGSFGKPFIQKLGDILLLPLSKREKPSVGWVSQMAPNPCQPVIRMVFFNLTTAVLTNNKRTYLFIYLFIIRELVLIYLNRHSQKNKEIMKEPTRIPWFFHGNCRFFELLRNSRLYISDLKKKQIQWFL